MSRLCIYCKHFDIDYEGAYSDVTPGSGFQAGCKEGVWWQNGDNLSPEGHRRCLEYGLTCEKFTAPDAGEGA